MNKIIGTLVIFTLIVLAGVSLIGKREVSTLGSVNQSNEYHSTSTSVTTGSSSFSTTAGDYKVLQTGPGTLGSVVITYGSNAPLRILDATSTKTNTEWATTTLADFKTTGTPGTYTFDVIFQKGLLVETVSTVGLASSTITYR